VGDAISLEAKIGTTGSSSPQITYFSLLKFSRNRVRSVLSFIPCIAAAIPSVGKVSASLVKPAISET